MALKVEEGGEVHLMTDHAGKASLGSSAAGGAAAEVADVEAVVKRGTRVKSSI